MISSEVFHQIPMYAQFEKYPKNIAFGDFNISYENDLAEYNTAEKFIYTNTTNAEIKNESNLTKIAGFGNSKLVEYEGLGAYFLDKISDGVWRLEVLPDAIWIDNPFGRNSLHKTVAVIKWNEWDMKLNLKDLGNDFQIEVINEGNNHVSKVLETIVNIMPGTYILSRKGSEKKWESTDSWNNTQLNMYVAPKSTVDKIYVNHTPIAEVTENISFEITAQIVSPTAPIEVQLVATNSSKREVLTMERTHGYNYAATLPLKLVEKGYLNYNIVVKCTDKTVTFPANKEGSPFNWDFNNNSYYQTSIVPPTFPIYLFNAKTDANLLVKEWRNEFKLLPTIHENEAEYQLNIEKLFVPDVENLNAEPNYDYSFKQFVIEKIRGRKSVLATKEKLVFYGNSLNNKPCKLQIAFVMNDGNSFGETIEIGTEVKEYEFEIKNVKQLKTVTLPRPYPTFLPYYLDADFTSKFDINNVESLQFSIGPGIPQHELNEKHGISIINVKLQ
jgi:hypothetical protein